MILYDSITKIVSFREYDKQKTPKSYKFIIYSYRFITDVPAERDIFAKKKLKHTEI